MTLLIGLLPLRPLATWAGAGLAR